MEVNALEYTPDTCTSKSVLNPSVNKDNLPFCRNPSGIFSMLLNLFTITCPLTC